MGKSWFGPSVQCDVTVLTSHRIIPVGFRHDGNSQEDTELKYLLGPALKSCREARVCIEENLS